MNQKLSKYKLEITGLVIGAIAGWCYWFFVGCASGTCPITSSPVISTIYGGILGALGISLFKKETGKSNKKQSVENE